MLSSQRGWSRGRAGERERSPRWPRRPRHRMPGPGVPQRVRSQPPGRRPGGELPHRAPRQPRSVPGPVREDRHIEVMRPYLDRATEPGVVAIGAAQEFQSVFTGYDHATKPGAVCFGFSKAERRVTVYYFYVLDREFGPGFIKLCSYFPYPGKVWVNGHEWAKTQADRARLAYIPLANGFASCSRPEVLQGICDRLGPADIQAFFDRWIGRIPTPLTDADRAAGYWWELSLRQVEVSRTVVFDQPRRARAFFEATVADNLDLGRPDEVQLVFARQVRRNTKGVFSTKVVTRGTDVIVNVFYRHSRIKEYLKEGRALRIETVVNSPGDLG